MVTRHLLGHKLGTLNHQTTPHLNSQTIPHLNPMTLLVTRNVNHKDNLLIIPHPHRHSITLRIPLLKLSTQVAPVLTLLVTQVILTLTGQLLLIRKLRHISKVTGGAVVIPMQGSLAVVNVATTTLEETFLHGKESMAAAMVTPVENQAPLIQEAVVLRT